MRTRAAKMHPVTKITLVAAIPFALLVGACGASYVAAPDYARSMGLETEQQTTIWTAFQPGELAVVAPSTAQCPEQVAEDLAGLDLTPRPLAAEPWAAEATVWTVESAVVKSSEGGYLAVGLTDQTGRKAWIKVPGGSAPTCIWPMNTDLDSAIRLRGNTTVFAPWRPTCKKIEAEGISAASTLLESEPGLVMDVGGVALGDIVETAEGPIRIPWIELHGGTIRVRGDTFRFCFAPAGSPEAAPPDSGLAMLHMPPGRCQSQDTQHGEHVACSTSVGVWEGEAAGDRVSLSIVRRTLGQVHFVGGKPVRGESFAKAVLSVETATTQRSDERAVYDSIRRSVAAALANSDGTFRVAQPGDPAINTTIKVSIANLTIGELGHGEEQHSSEYQDGTRTIQNQRKPELHQEWMQAQQRVQQAEVDYQDAIATHQMFVEQGDRTCRDGCGLLNDANQQTICYSGCDVGKIAAELSKPDRDGITQAQNDEINAQSAYQSEPETIAEPIMKTHYYKKKLLSRSASATVKIRITPKGEQATEKTNSFSNSWGDYDVDSEPQYNVDGHPANAAWIDRPEALLPYVGEAMAQVVAGEMRTAVSRAALRELRREASGAGLDSKGGYEDVDAVAVGVARDRLDSRVQIGTSDLSPSAPSPLPSRAVRLGPTDCLLAVAVLPEGQTGAITMKTQSGSHGDLRRKSFAAIEVCAYELRPGEQTTEEIQLTGEAASQVRWGLYRTKAGEGTPLPATPSVAQPPTPATPPASAPQLAPAAPRPAAPKPPTARPAPRPAQPTPRPAPVASPPIGARPASAQPAPMPATTTPPIAVAPRPDSGDWKDLESEDPEVRLAGIAMITAKKETGAMPALRRIVAEDPVPKVRIEAWKAIGKLGTKDDVAELEPIRLKEKKKKVRAAARKAVKGLLKRKKPN
ncbi:MAG: HEAT repeat domain-containing protein [Deltaproteobacteria bacterium]|nr:HEAT repeat domain-containing protein [Deltaproteobacteria bacterium]